MRSQELTRRPIGRAARLGSVGATALALCWLAAAELRADTDVDRTIDAAPGATIEIENTSGSVRVRGWDREQVRVTGWLGENVEELVVEGSRDNILIEVEAPDRNWRRRDFDARLEISVPRSARVEIETVSASVDVEEFNGRLEAETVSGSIEVDGAPSTATLESVSGSIRVRGSNTSVRAESVSGSIRLEGVSARIEASTVSGTIDVHAGQIERGDLESVSGTVRLECGLARGARLDVSSHSGNVTLTLPADVSASFEAETFSGSIDNEFGPQAERTSKWVPSKSLEFTTGDGSAEVILETFSGNLRIERR